MVAKNQSCIIPVILDSLISICNINNSPSNVEANRKKAREETENEAQAVKREGIHQTLSVCSCSLSCVLHTPGWQK